MFEDNEWYNVKTVFSPVNIFTYMDLSTFQDILLDEDEINILFLTFYSSRIVTPLVENFCDVNHELTDDTASQLAQIIWRYYYKKWLKYYDTLRIEYNPIYNYHDEHTGTDTTTTSQEKEKEDKTKSDSGNLRTFQNVREITTHNTTDTDTHNTTETETQNLEEDVTNNTTDTTTYDSSSTLTLNTSKPKTIAGSKDTVHDYTATNPSDVYSETSTDTRSKNDNDELITNKIWAFNTTAESGIPQSTSATSTDYKNTNVKNISGKYKDSETFTNYSETETNTGTETTDKTGTDSLEKIGTTTTQNTGTDTLTKTGTDTLTKTGTDTKENVGTIADTHYHDMLITEDNNSEEVVEYNSLHEGNIGNLTTQHLIEEELELRRETFIQRILNDVKELVTLDIYL